MKVASVSHICYLIFQAHLCPVGPRVLDSCSLNIRAIHIREAYEPPWARAWFILISWGHKLVWGFIYYPVLMPCFTALLRLCKEHLYCLGKRNVFAVSTSPVIFSGSQSFTAIDANLESVSEPANFVAGSLMGWPPEIFLNLVIALSWMPRWVLIWFSEVDRVCVAICAPLQGKTFWKPCPRLWTTWSTVSRS